MVFYEKAFFNFQPVAKDISLSGHHWFANFPPIWFITLHVTWLRTCPMNKIGKRFDLKAKSFTKAPARLNPQPIKTINRTENWSIMNVAGIISATNITEMSFKVIWFVDNFNPSEIVIWNPTQCDGASPGDNIHRNIIIFCNHRCARQIHKPLKINLDHVLNE